VQASRLPATDGRQPPPCSPPGSRCCRWRRRLRLPATHGAPPPSPRGVLLCHACCAAAAPGAAAAGAFSCAAARLAGVCGAGAASADAAGGGGAGCAARASHISERGFGCASSSGCISSRQAALCKSRKVGGCAPCCGSNGRQAAIAEGWQRCSRRTTAQRGRRFAGGGSTLHI
jgi:hypothetical protein